MPCPAFIRPGKALLLYYSTNSVEEQSRFRKMNFCCQKWFLCFPGAQPFPAQGFEYIFLADTSVFDAANAKCNFSHLKGEELTVLHLYKICFFCRQITALTNPQKETILQIEKVLSAWSAPYPTIKIDCTSLDAGGSQSFLLSSFFFCENLSMTSMVRRITSTIKPSSVRMTIKRFDTSVRFTRYPSFRLQGSRRFPSKKFSSQNPCFIPCRINQR